VCVFKVCKRRTCKRERERERSMSEAYVVCKVCVWYLMYVCLFVKRMVCEVYGVFVFVFVCV
jgi:hypothetical protein